MSTPNARTEDRTVVRVNELTVVFGQMNLKLFIRLKLCLCFNPN